MTGTLLLFSFLFSFFFFFLLLSLLLFSITLKVKVTSMHFYVNRQASKKKHEQKLPCAQKSIKLKQTNK